MSYINFKEEIYVAKTQLKHRNDNNSNLIAQMRHSQDDYTENYDKHYSFKDIKSRVINNAKIQKEDEFLTIEHENIVCAHFIYCKFYNIRFFECSFVGCIFENCDFGGGGVVFENCTFIKSDTDKTPSLNIKDNLSCTFKDCTLYIKFLSCDISYGIFDYCKIINTNFELTDATSIIIIDSEMNKINIIDSDFSGVKVVNTYIEDLEFNDKVKTKLDEKTFFDKIQYKKKTREEYEGIYMVYQNIANLCHNNNLRNNFGEYYYLARCTERKTLDLLPKIVSTTELLTSGYGERIFTPLFASLFFCFVFAVIYIFSGLVIDGRLIRYELSTIFNSNFRQLLTDFNVSLKVSLGIFGGIGEDIAQTTGNSYMISNLETILGVVMMGIGIGTLTRKIVR